MKFNSLLAAAALLSASGVSGSRLRHTFLRQAPVAPVAATAAVGSAPLAASSPCPAACSGRGKCEVPTPGAFAPGAPTAPKCLCAKGYGGPDCAQEMPEWLEVKASDFVDPTVLETELTPAERVTLKGQGPRFTDMVGRYKLESMFLYKPPVAPAAPATPAAAAAGAAAAEPPIRFIHYDPVRAGWAVSKIGSTCVDDTCFFAYDPTATKESLPVKSGYSYGNSVLHLYNQNLIQTHKDMGDPTGNKVDNYTVSLSFTQDPAVSEGADLSEFNGDYQLVPRYVLHSCASSPSDPSGSKCKGKYSIFPVDFNSPGRQWVLTGLLGTPKRRTVLLKSMQGVDQPSMSPLAGWTPAPNSPAARSTIDSIPENGIIPILPPGVTPPAPPAAAAGAPAGAFTFQIYETCANHVNDMTCYGLNNQCPAVHSDGAWVRACCRLTCNSCFVSRSECKLPVAGNVAPAMGRTAFFM